MLGVQSNMNVIFVKAMKLSLKRHFYSAPWIVRFTSQKKE